MGLVLGDLGDRFGGTALRVPVPDGSLTDLTVELSERVGPEEVNAAFRSAAAGEMAGVLEYSEAALVSADIIGNPASCVFDAPLTLAAGRIVKVFGWYDNEWGYSNRLVDLAERLWPRLADAA
jgi:glyceraldehyde 3-phosphate dehydrogenase